MVPVPAEVVQTFELQLSSLQASKLCIVDSFHFLVGCKKPHAVCRIALVVKEGCAILLGKRCSYTQLLQNLDEDLVALTMYLGKMDMLEVCFGPCSAWESPFVFVQVFAMLWAFICRARVDYP